MARKVVRPRSREPFSIPYKMERERFAPFGALGKKKIMTIPWQDIRPTIRWMKGIRMSDRHMLPRIIFDYLLVFFVDGEGTYIIGKDEIPIQKRHLFLVPPFTVNSFKMRGSHFFTSIHFDWRPNFPSSPQLSGREPYQVRFPLNVQIPAQQVLVAGDPLVMQFQQILELWNEEDELSDQQANALLFDVVITLLKRAKAKTPSEEGHHIHTDHKRVEIVLALMQERLAEDLTLQEMAKAAGLSVGHFSYVFRKWIGHSPIEHLIKLRMQRAKELLEDVHLTIKEVAIGSGFRDYSYFSRKFVQFNSVSPSQYREMILAQCHRGN